MILESIGQKINFLESRPKKLHPAAALALSFLALISVGTTLLSLPFSSRTGSVPFLDALFTATSATCVTGLTVLQTGSDWTPAGQLVILGLIQLGGLGIMTFSTFFAFIFSRRMSIRSRDLLEQSVAGRPVPNLGFILIMIVIGTLIFESIGAAVLTLRFASEFPLQKAVFLGVFHAVSAFCNAGFSLFTQSFMGYRQDLIINLTLILLIISGGLGFGVLFDLKSLWKKRHLSFHSKIVLSHSAGLILVGFFAILFLEWGNTLAGVSLPGKLLASLFQSVTARTAGFNTLDISHLTSSSLLILMILMMIGASPGSCGGGIKTTTFAVIMAINFSRLKDHRQVRLFNRGIPEPIISKSLGIAFFWIIVLTLATLFLLITEHPGGPHSEGRTLFIEVVFECFSALGTVGLSMGLTPVLTSIGKMLIILLMYVGRIGPVTLALAIAGKPPLRYRYAEEHFLVG